MSDLLVIGYGDEATATRVLGELGELQADYLIDLDDAAVITRDGKGKLHVTTPYHPVASGTLSGMFWGMLIGLIFLVPVGGLVLGGLMGAAMGKAGDMGIKDDFKARVNDLVKPGTSAILMVVRCATPDKVLEALKPYGGTVLQTSLSQDAEEKLMKALHHDEETS